ncbi:MAG: hypothetical protein CMJ11_06275 [Pelagibacterales bacterium]|nr:hypothetical protein [Pelagibacterales bacterium]|tara:strand:+ start:9451 stop:9801 length:351 start_codon:yes stop_codon:yes gene_type:complete
MNKVNLEDWKKSELKKFSIKEIQIIEYYEQLLNNPKKAKTEEEIHFLRVMFSNYEATNTIEKYFVEKQLIVSSLNAPDTKHDIEDAPIGGRNFRSLKDSKWYAEYHKDYDWNEFIW